MLTLEGKYGNIPDNKEYTAILFNPKKLILHDGGDEYISKLHGVIYKDKKGRFDDGAVVYTTNIKEILDFGSEWVLVKTKSNSVYFVVYGTDLFLDLMKE